MDIIGQLTGSGFLGTIGGVLGSLATRWVEYRTMKAKAEHELAMTKLHGQLELKGREFDLQGQQIQGEIDVELASEESLRKSFEHDAALGAWMSAEHATGAQRWVMVIVDAFRKLIRPVLTVGTVGYVMHAYSQHFALVAAAGGVSAEQAMAHANLILSAITAMATMAFSWWFADRQLQKRVTEKLFGD